ncbi:MAG TPA: serine/threonine-protein kinase, partial [Polyangiaceae bacterium]|nr:serine/threonine-protein kinase [Polyangiaceae bacterium]
RPDTPLGRALEREASAYARLEHPHVPSLHDYVSEAQRAWLVLADCGVPVRKALELPLPARVASAVGASVCRALSHAHERDMVHGGLAVEHVFVREDGRVSVLGFGLSPQREDSVEPLPLGHPGNLAPESALGQAPSVASDVFAIGALLFELLTGTSPFARQEASEGRAARTDEAPSLVSRGAVVPADLELLVKRCLSRLPGKRPESAAEIGRQLEALAEAAPDEVVRAALTGAQPAPKEDRRATFRPTAWGRGVLFWFGCIVGVAAAAGVVALVRHRESAHPRPPVTWELAPSEHPVHLRAVAHPWAHVVVDGVRRETTPFALPIVLSPGPHEIRFEHPNARTEVRRIDASPGESVFLDVSLKVERPLPTDPWEQPPDDSP